MTNFAIHFVDPTMPGISGRDLIERAVTSVQTTHERAGNVYWAMRRDLVLRKGLSRLDRRLLRDIGIDRNAA
jgi:uncharacterized protein YjiS (DUF1127 family)